MKELNEIDFAYYDGMLYRLRYRTQQPPRPELLVYAIATKFGDTEKRTHIYRRSEKGVTYYHPIPLKVGQYDSEISYDLIQLERDRVIHIVTNLSDDLIYKLPSIWVVELHDGGYAVIPEAKLHI